MHSSQSSRQLSVGKMKNIMTAKVSFNRTSKSAIFFFLYHRYNFVNFFGGGLLIEDQ